MFIEFGTILGIPAVSPMDEITAVPGSSRGWLVILILELPTNTYRAGMDERSCFAPSQNIISKYSVLRTPHSRLY